MAKITDVEITSLLFDEQGSTPTTPASTDWRLYFKSDGLYYVDDAGAVTGPLVVGASLGAWTDYTPTFTASSSNPTLGSSVITGRYKALDSKTYLTKGSLSITTGGAWNAGSGDWQFGLPASKTASGLSVGSLQILDNGTRRYAGVSRVVSGDTFLKGVVADASSDFSLKNNIPVTWATGDYIEWQIIIEVA